MASPATNQEEQDSAPGRLFFELDREEDGDHHDSSLSSFSDIPAELRNDIYRRCLTSRRPLEIEVDFSFRVPALLQVSRQIRTEASPIFLYENRLLFDFSDLDCSIYKAFFTRTVAAKVFARRGPGVRMYAEIPRETSMVWSNLLEWLKLFHDEGTTLRPWSTRNGGLRRNAAADAFDLVKQMRNKIPWEDIVKVLEVYKGAMEIQADGNWKWT